MRRFSIEEWVIPAVKALYQNAKSHMRLHGQLSGKFNIKVAVDQGAVLSPLLFIIVMEALSRKLKSWLPLENADGLVLIVEKLEESKKAHNLETQYRGKRANVNVNK